MCSKKINVHMKTVIDKCSLISSNQYSFRAERCIINTLYNLFHYIAQNFDTGIDTADIFIDASKLVYLLMSCIFSNNNGFRSLVLSLVLLATCYQDNDVFIIIKYLHPVGSACLCFY